MGMYSVGNDFYKEAKFEYKYCLLPRRCYLSNDLLWFTTAIRGRRIVDYYDGLQVYKAYDDRWYNSSEGLIMMIKGVSNGTI